MGPLSEPKIPHTLWAEVYRRHKEEGQSDPQIAAWLNEAHGIPATRLDVWRTRDRYKRRVLPPESDPEPRRPEELSPTEVQIAPGIVVETAPQGIPLGDEDLLRFIVRSLGVKYGKTNDLEAQLMIASVLAKTAGVLRLVKKDRVDLERAGKGENQGPPVKGYLIVSPEDWPEAPGAGDPKAAAN